MVVAPPMVVAPQAQRRPADSRTGSLRPRRRAHTYLPDRRPSEALAAGQSALPMPRGILALQSADQARSWLRSCWLVSLRLSVVRLSLRGLVCPVAGGGLLSG